MLALQVRFDSYRTQVEAVEPAWEAPIALGQEYLKGPAENLWQQLCLVVDAKAF
jgi:hypothetical protein